MKKFIVLLLAALIVFSFCCGLAYAQGEIPGEGKIPPATTPSGRDIPARDMIPAEVLDIIDDKTSK